MSPSVIGLLRGVGVAVLIAILTYLGDATHLSGVVSASIASIISALALMVEHQIEAKTGSALFGAVKSR